MSRWNAEIVVALAFIVIGVLLLAGNLGLMVFDWGMAWSLALIFFGVWLVWRAFQPAPMPGMSYGVGSLRPRLAGKEIRDENFSHSFGDFDLDLTTATIPEGQARVRASIGLGDLTVILPRDLAVRVYASAGLGDVQVLDREDDGIAPRIEFESEDYATATRKLELHASAGIGGVKVIRD
jgi:hypothetical protein